MSQRVAVRMPGTTFVRAMSSGRQDAPAKRHSGDAPLSRRSRHGPEGDERNLAVEHVHPTSSVRNARWCLSIRAILDTTDAHDRVYARV